MRIPLLYRESPPARPLQPWVECYWTLEGAAPPGTVRRVLPDGCMDILFVLDGSPSLPRGAAGARAIVVGTQLTTLEVAQEGMVRLLGVRFRPGALPTFVPMAAACLVDAGAPLEQAGPPGWRDLAACLHGTAPDDRPALLDRLLTRRLAGRRQDDLARRAAALLVRPGAPDGTDALADRLGVGRRTLERRFRGAVGVGPGTLARILRFRAASEALAAHPTRSISAIAAACGYADHPHLSREFRTMAGISPTAFRRVAGAERADTGGTA